MQLDTPKLVRIALMIAATVCRMNFHVSFFFFAIVYSSFLSILEGLDV